MAIIQGNTFVDQVTITDEFLNEVYDPTTVTFSYQIGATAIVILSYSGASAPALSVVARLATGSYIVMLDLTNINTNITWRWDTTSPNGPSSLPGVTAVTPNRI